MKGKIPRSLRKFIRRQKAEIRRKFLDVKKQNELIKQLYENTRHTKLINKAGNRS
jgi:hypothetical protein